MSCVDVKHIGLLICVCPAATPWNRFQEVGTTAGLQRETGTTAPPRPPSLPWLNTRVSLCLNAHQAHGVHMRPARRGFFFLCCLHALVHPLQLEEAQCKMLKQCSSILIYVRLCLGNNCIYSFLLYDQLSNSCSFRE